MVICYILFSAEIFLKKKGCVSIKKSAIIITALLFTLCGCSESAPSYSRELTESRWSAKLEGGAELSLGFSGEPDDLRAELSISNAGEFAEISGRCLIDEGSFVIFDAQSAQNYAFEYTPKGSTLEISYNSNILTLQKQA